LTTRALSGIVRSSFSPALRLPSVAASTLSSKRRRASAPAAKVVPVVPAASGAGARQAANKPAAKAPAAKAGAAKVVARRGRLAATVTVAKPAARVAPKPLRQPAAKPVRKAAAKRTAAKRAPAKPTPAKRGATKSTRRSVPAPVRVVKVKSLDPFARCGPGTSVEHLYRVDENVDGRATVHLVFFDQYGWYCVHGRGCGAVADVHQELRAQRRSVPRLATTTRAAGR
jgi:hypothetical protein